MKRNDQTCYLRDSQTQAQAQARLKLASSIHQVKSLRS